MMRKKNSSVISVRFTSGKAVVEDSHDDGCSLAMKRFLVGILTGYCHNNDLALSVIKAILYGNYRFSPLRLTIIGDVIRIVPDPDDIIVISALDNILRDMIILYYYEVSREMYYGVKTLYDYTSTVSSWRDLDGVLCVSVALSYQTLSNKRLIERIRPIIHNDKRLLDLISSYCCDLSVIDLDGDVCDEDEVALYPNGNSLSRTLISILLENVDLKFIELYPAINYVRYSNEFLFPIYDIEMQVPTLLHSIRNVFQDVHIRYPSVLCAFRGGDPIKINNGILQIDELSGMCIFKPHIKE